MAMMRKKEAADHFGVDKQWIGYVSKKQKDGTFPQFVSENGELIDVENSLLINKVKKKKAKTSRKEIRGDKRDPKKKPGRKTSSPKKQKPVVEEKETALADNIDLDDASIEKFSNEKNVDKLQRAAEMAKCMGEIYTAASKKAKYEEDRGSQIKRDLVESVFSYLDNLSKDLFQQKVTLEPNIRASIESGASHIDVVAMMRESDSKSIKFAKSEIRKILQKRNK